MSPLCAHIRGSLTAYRGGASPPAQNVLCTCRPAALPPAQQPSWHVLQPELPGPFWRHRRPSAVAEWLRQSPALTCAAAVFHRLDLLSDVSQSLQTQRHLGVTVCVCSARSDTPSRLHLTSQQFLSTSAQQQRSRMTLCVHPPGAERVCMVAVVCMLDCTSKKLLAAHLEAGISSETGLAGPL